MEKRTRIHLGSGRHPWPGWINVDLDPRADVQCDVTKLEFEDCSVDEIQAIHLFEHIDRLEAANTLLEWRRVLKKGGKLVLEMPCMDKIAQMIVDGETKVNWTLFGIFGDVRESSPYMKHQWCYTQKEIFDLFNEYGFEAEIQEPVFHLKKRDMRITGVKK